MVVIVMKTSFQRLKSRVKNYRDYKYFKNELFWDELLHELLNATFEENTIGFGKFTETCQKRHVPTKSMYGKIIFHFRQNPFKSNNTQDQASQ